MYSFFTLENILVIINWRSFPIKNYVLKYVKVLLFWINMKNYFFLYKRIYIFTTFIITVNQFKKELINVTQSQYLSTKVNIFLWLNISCIRINILWHRNFLLWVLTKFINLGPILICFIKNLRILIHQNLIIQNFVLWNVFRKLEQTTF